MNYSFLPCESCELSNKAQTSFNHYCDDSLMNVQLILIYLCSVFISFIHAFNVCNILIHKKCKLGLPLSTNKSKVRNCGKKTN